MESSEVPHEMGRLPASLRTAAGGGTALRIRLKVGLGAESAYDRVQTLPLVHRWDLGRSENAGISSYNANCVAFENSAPGGSHDPSSSTDDFIADGVQSVFTSAA